MIPWFKSKTIWFNLLMVVLGLVAYLQNINTFNKYAVAFGIVTTLGNLVLRYFFTSTSIGPAPTVPSVPPTPPAPMAGG